MHLAYFLKPVEATDGFDELRFSLRSAQENLPDIESVWIVGGKPAWLTGVQHVDGNRFGDKQRNVYDNVRIIAEHPDLPDEIVVMNDDFITMQPAKPEPAWRCLLSEHLDSVRAGWWRRSLEATQAWLHEQGHADPLSYELHRPFPVIRPQMADVLAKAHEVQPDNPPQWRTLYGNAGNIGGEQDADTKLYGHTGIPDPAVTWLSTTDRGWRRSCCLRSYLAGRFHKPSRWET